MTKTLCAARKIEGSIKFGGIWAVPKLAQRPADFHVKSGKYRNWRKPKKDDK